MRIGNEGNPDERNRRSFPSFVRLASILNVAHLGKEPVSDRLGATGEGVSRRAWGRGENSGRE
jgi:hypothetical protein